MSRTSIDLDRNSLLQRARHMPLAYSVRAAPRLRAGAGTDWPAVIDGCRDLLAIVFGQTTNMDTFERTCREAGCKAVSRLEDPRILRARRLLVDDDLSYERAYAEFMRDRPTPESTVDALVYSLRRGVDGLTTLETQRRLLQVDAAGIKAVCRRVQNFKPEIASPSSAEETAALIAKWRELHG